MKHITKHITDKNEFQLMALGDFHIGDEFCDLDEIKRALKYVEDTPNCYLILNGDLINNALKTSKSDSYRETMTMEEEQDLLVELLTPVKDKILILASGNHEYRTTLLTGINPLRYVAASLGCMNVLCEDGYTLHLQFGQNMGVKNATNKYNIFGIHGSGGGRRIGSAANNLEDMKRVIPNADLYIHSHTHSTLSWIETVLEITNSGVKEKQQVFYNTTAFLKYGGYAERAKMKPSCTAINVINIRAKRHKKTMEIVTDIIRI